MVKGYGFNSKPFVVKNYFAAVGGEGMQPDVEIGHRPGVAQLCRHNFVQAMLTVNVQIFFAVVQVHGEEQAHQAQVMIAMQVRDKYMINAMDVSVKAGKLQLCAFTTINQKMFVLYLYQLGRGIPSVSRYGTA